MQGIIHQIDDTLRIIFSFIKEEELFDMRSTCKTFQRVITNNVFTSITITDGNSYLLEFNRKNLRNLAHLKYNWKNGSYFFNHYLQSSNTISYFQTLTYLNCSDNICIAIPLFPNLMYLDCTRNNVTFIPSFQRLKTLHCSENRSLMTIPMLPSLEILRCRQTHLKELPMFPKLTYLDCSINDLSMIPTFKRLETLRCTDNPNIQSIPDGLPALTALYCDFNPLIEYIPASLENLKWLSCERCSIKKIPSFKQLKRLDCSDNAFLLQIEECSELKYLNCTSCPLLKKIPSMKLEQLWCSSSGITHIPFMPTLRRLSCPDHLPFHDEDTYVCYYLFSHVSFFLKFAMMEMFSAIKTYFK